MFTKIYVEITNVCNLNCEFCPKTRRPVRTLSPTEFRQIAQQARPMTDFLYFHVMGEPLVHPQLETLLNIAEELGFRVVLTTNGSLLPERKETLLKARALHKVNISLHSFEANAWRDDNGEKFFDYLLGCADFAEKACNSGILCNFRLRNLDGEGTVGLRKQNEEIIKWLQTNFPEPWVKNSRGFRIKNGLFLEWGEVFQWPGLEEKILSESGFCYGLRTQIGILSDGTVIPCCLDHEGDLALGNVLEEPLKNILQSPRAQKIYAGFSQRKRVEPLCQRCGFAQRFAAR